MTNEEIEKLIAETYNIEDSLNLDIENLLEQITRETTYKEMDSIIVDKIRNNNLTIGLESIDMSSSINLLNQLLIATSENNSKD